MQVEHIEYRQMELNMTDGTFKRLFRQLKPKLKGLKAKYKEQSLQWVQVEEASCTSSAL